jgi:hypothetical protein
MRFGFWRRFVVALALLVGLGIATPVAEASAAPAPASAANLPAVGKSPQAIDWWW